MTKSMCQEFAAISILVASTLVCGPATAQGKPAERAEIKGIKWTELQRVELVTAPGKFEVLGIAEIAAGVAADRHTHEDYEVGFVLEGEFSLHVDGQAPRTVRTGESFAILPGKAHYGHNTGRVPAKVLVTYVVGKGRPLSRAPE